MITERISINFVIEFYADSFNLSETKHCGTRYPMYVPSALVDTHGVPGTVISAVLINEMRDSRAFLDIGRVESVQAGT